MCNRNPIAVEENSPRAGLELGTARSAGQHLTHCATGARMDMISIQSGIIPQSEDGVMALILCNPSDDASYLFKVS